MIGNQYQNLYNFLNNLDSIEMTVNLGADVI